MNAKKNYGGWTGKILRVDLGKGEIRPIPSGKYTGKFIGGKGLNHRLAWDELKPGTKAFDEDNCLFISVGPLTGTAAPNSGRATIGGVSAQSHPEMYTHSGVGGWFPPAIKYAGYDAIIIKGKSKFPCYLYIDNDDVIIKRADDLWGLGTYDTQRLLKRKHGPGVRSLCIGPAGENLSRIAVLLTDTENAAGQGGFGGVAGSKNLKAICIKGSNHVKIAHPEKLLKLRKDNMPPAQKTPLIKDMPFTYDGQTVEDLPYLRNRVSCSHSCDRHCFWNFHDVPGVTRPALLSGKWGCVGVEAAGWQAPFNIKWPLWGKTVKGKPGNSYARISKESARSGFEISRLFNQYGVNVWDVLAGMVPWLVMGHRAVPELFDIEWFDRIRPIDADDPEWWVKLIKTIAYPPKKQKNQKDTCEQWLFQGSYRTIKHLAKEDKRYEDTMYQFEKAYPTPINLEEAWGYPGHWSGRGIHSCLEFPYYLLRALAWMTASRDPMDDTHFYLTKEQGEAIRKQWSDETIDHYKQELIPRLAIWNEHRSELKSSLTLCDWAFPNNNNTALESELFSAVTGMECTEKELDLIGERLKNMQRLLLMKLYGRNAGQELKEIAPWFERGDGTTGKTVPRGKLAEMAAVYYQLRGWDKNGHPTKEKLEELGLENLPD